MKKAIKFCWMAPGNINIPSPAFSVLKSFLETSGFKVDVHYWNMKFHKLQCDFIWNDSFHVGDSDNLKSLYLYYNYLAVKNNDIEAYNNIKTSLKEIKPQYMCAGTSFFDDHMHEYAEKAEKAFSEAIEEIDFTQVFYWGMSVNLYQWVATSIIADKIKKNNPEIPILIGGVGTPETAVAYLDNFKQFDVAFWGEAEFSLLDYSTQIKDGNLNLSQVCNIAYRQGESIETSVRSRKKYVDLSSKNVRADYKDYFTDLKKYEIQQDGLCLPIEGSRSCHWKKCHFCYLNQGYKYRKKGADPLINELEYFIGKHKINKFQFLDNDIIGSNLAQFELFLDKLILFKEKHVDFQIILAEIISKGLSKEMIRKMALAGFQHVQIGYESPSDGLLRKIDKKNTFSSNLLFLKFANEYNISVTGANVLRNLLEETNEDILEAIDNLYYLRFLLIQGWFQHNISTLGINSSSKYFEHIKNDLGAWGRNLMSSMLPEDYLKEDNAHHIIEFIKNTYNLLWNQFESIEAYFIKNKFEYKIFKKKDKLIYREFCNYEQINELEINYNSQEYYILKNVNDSVTSINNIVDLSQKEKMNYNRKDLMSAMQELRNEGLIFHSSDTSEIISIINLDRTYQ